MDTYLFTSRVVIPYGGLEAADLDPFIAFDLFNYFDADHVQLQATPFDALTLGESTSVLIPFLAAFVTDSLILGEVCVGTLIFEPNVSDTSAVGDTTTLRVPFLLTSTIEDITADESATVTWRSFVAVTDVMTVGDTIIPNLLLLPHGLEGVVVGEQFGATVLVQLQMLDDVGVGAVVGIASFLLPFVIDVLELGDTSFIVLGAPIDIIGVAVGSDILGTASGVRDILGTASGVRDTFL